jgi:hypothetical protein
LGIQIGEDETQDGNDSIITPLVSPLVGITVAETSGITPISVDDHMASAVGVIVGTYATDIEAPPLIVGNTYVLTVRGQNLNPITSAIVMPGLDLLVGTPLPAVDGSSLSVLLTIPAGVSIEPRVLKLFAEDTLVSFKEPHQAILGLAFGPPSIASLTPIVLRPGDTGDLLVRGQNLQYTQRIFAEPGQGIRFLSRVSSTADGIEARVRIHIEPNAPLGAHTMRIETPGGVTTDQAMSANTLTIY